MAKPNYDLLAKAGDLHRRRAIRLKCLDCCGGQSAEVRRCHITTCPLHPFRMGALSKGVPEGHGDAGDALDSEKESVSGGLDGLAVQP